MNGQWIGYYHARNSGMLVLDLDDRGDTYEGELLVYGYPIEIPPVAPSTTPLLQPLPPLLAHVSLPKSEDKWVGQLSMQAVERGTAREMTPEEVQKALPGIVVPKNVDVQIQRDGGNLKIEWRAAPSDEHSQQWHGTAILSRTLSNSSSRLVPSDQIKTWEKFKEWATGLEPQRFVFRGQPAPWKLRTAFHRSGRASLLPIYRA